MQLLYKTKKQCVDQAVTLIIGKQLCKGIAILTQPYCLIHINMSTTCFGLYGHRQAGYNIGGKLHNIIWYRTNICVVSVGGRDLVYKD